MVNGPELLSEFVGDSEACMHALFIAARALAPCILFFDEIDALAPARTGMAVGSNVSASDTSARVLGTLLVEMDGLHGAGDQCAPFLFVHSLFVHASSCWRSVSTPFLSTPAFCSNANDSAEQAQPPIPKLEVECERNLQRMCTQ